VCELLGMSANVPTDICFSFSGLIRRGGATGPHKDGWGIAFYEGRSLREFRDPQPSYVSEMARFVRDYPIKSRIVISHIRQANVGGVALENTHPFARELWGRIWCFAHNGQLSTYDDLVSSHFSPVGTTDSERAFCWLLGGIKDQLGSERAGMIDPLAEIIKCHYDRLRERGVFNMLFSDSEHLFVYCSTKLSWITRRSPFGKATLHDEDITVDFEQVTTPNDVVTVIATEPLTRNETWHSMQSGELLVFKDGAVVRRLV